MISAKVHPHALLRLGERGATLPEVMATVAEGERTPAKQGRVRFSRNFPYNGYWNGRKYGTKQIHAIAVEEDGYWLVLTVIVKFY